MFLLDSFKLSIEAVILAVSLPFEDAILFSVFALFMLHLRYKFFGFRFSLGFSILELTGSFTLVKFSHFHISVLSLGFSIMKTFIVYIGFFFILIFTKLFQFIFYLI